MTDLQFIVGLMRTEASALGFIPTPAIERNHTARGLYVIQHDRHNRPVGYILHGPPAANRPLRIYQCCVDFDHRLRYHATQAVDRVIQRARDAHATDLFLRCALDLEANHFWRALGFQLVAIRDGGLQRKRLIGLYRLPLPPPPPLLLTIPAWQFA